MGSDAESHIVDFLSDHDIAKSARTAKRWANLKSTRFADYTRNVLVSGRSNLFTACTVPHATHLRELALENVGNVRLLGRSVSCLSRLTLCGDSVLENVPEIDTVRVNHLVLQRAKCGLPSCVDVTEKIILEEFSRYGLSVVLKSMADDAELPPEVLIRHSVVCAHTSLPVAIGLGVENLVIHGGELTWVMHKRKSAERSPPGCHVSKVTSATHVFFDNVRGVCETDLQLASLVSSLCLQPWMKTFTIASELMSRSAYTLALRRKVSKLTWTRTFSHAQSDDVKLSVHG